MQRIQRFILAAVHKFGVYCKHCGAWKSSEFEYCTKCGEVVPVYWTGRGQK